MKFKLFQLVCVILRGKVPLAPSSPDLSDGGKGRLGWSQLSAFVPQHLRRGGVRFLRFPLMRHRPYSGARDKSLCVSPGGETLPLRLPVGSPHPLPAPPPPNPPQSKSPPAQPPGCRVNESKRCAKDPGPTLPTPPGEKPRGQLQAASSLLAGDTQSETQETTKRPHTHPPRLGRRRLPWERAV